MLESTLKKHVMKYLKQIPDSHFWKTHGSNYGVGGISDIVGLINGRFIAIELKVGKNEPTPLQKVFIKKVQDAGGVAFAAWSLNDVRRELSLAGLVSNGYAY